MGKRDFCHLDALLIARWCIRAHVQSKAASIAPDDLVLLVKAMTTLDTDLIGEEATVRPHHKNLAAGVVKPNA